MLRQETGNHEPGTLNLVMRVIGGIYGGRTLRTLAGLEVRPTSDRLRETLFNILTPDSKGARLLDTCAGSGGVGIEALSRGATEAWFIDKSRRACAVIEKNLEELGGSGNATIINRDAAAASRLMIVALPLPPSSSRFFSITAQARRDLSINHASVAPRLSASIPTPPDPAQVSSNLAPLLSGVRILKSVSRSRSEVGRTSRPASVRNVLPP